MIPYSRTKLSDFFTLSQSKKPYPSQWHIPVYPYTDLPTPKRQKMPVSEPRAGKSSEEWGVSVCGIAVLGHFWWGVAVIFISKYGIAVFRVQAVCGKFKFYATVVGEKIFVSR